MMLFIMMTMMMVIDVRLNVRRMECHHYDDAIDR